jgi:diguanylate cyclase (GGDEF)-like protein/PAS domain S-box-containing protein
MKHDDWAMDHKAKKTADASRFDLFLDNLARLRAENHRAFVEMLDTIEKDLRKLHLLEIALDQLPDEFYIKDPESRFLFANKATELVNGVASGELIGKTDHDLYPDASADRFRKEEILLMESGTPVQRLPEWRKLADGHPYWFQANKYPLTDGDGANLGLLGFTNHNTVQKQTEAMLHAQTTILQMVIAQDPLTDIIRRITTLIADQLSGISPSIVLLDETGQRITDVVATNMDDAYSNMLIGIEIGDNVGSCGTACFRRQTVIVSDLMNDPLWADYRDLVEPYGYRSCWSEPILHFDGTAYGSFALYSKQVITPGEFELRLMSLGSKLAEIAIERDRATKRVKVAVEQDSLTGLHNRSSFNNLLAETLAGAKGRPFALAFIDLDDFKNVNDRHGHKAGDIFLKTLALRMAQAISAGDIVARIGGDEFALIMTEPLDAPRDYVEKASRLLAQISDPVRYGDQQFAVSASIGVAVFPEHGQDASTLLGNADAAMYRAKRSGRSHIELFDQSISREIQARSIRTGELRASIADGEIDIDFQPLFDLRQSRIFGFEALARWNHPRLGRLGPATFIEIAEESGLIVPLGQAVLTKACHAAFAWQKLTSDPISVSVNVSAHQFRNGAIRDQVRTALRETGLPGHLLELELTESMLLEDEHAAAEIMGELASLGLTIALDDFGTGFSNLSALAAFPLDRLKIDRSIVRGVERNPAAAAITSAIIAMGQKLGMQVLAEGVETAAQLDFLIDNGCDGIQGYIVGRPAALTSAERLLIRR